MIALRVRCLRPLGIVYAALIAAAWGVVPQGQAQSVPASASLTGCIRDVQGRAVAKATIKINGNNLHLSPQTDAAGNYSISLVPGTYSAHAEAAGFEPASFGPVTITKDESKTINFVLRLQAPQQQSSLGAPNFFDQPQFTIAGVRDTSNLSGHASGSMGPARASLAKELTSAPVGVATSDAALEQAARDAADREPNNFEANYRAGVLLLQNFQPRDALAYLQRANSLRPDDDLSSFQLAQAFADAGEYNNARALIPRLQSKRDSADLHHLLGNIQEKAGNPLVAVRELQEAAKLDPSEANIFDWGAELLSHRAIEPAIQVFSNGTRRFPASGRMRAGLGVASYELGSYEAAVRYLCEAADMNPRDSNAYLLLGEMQNADNGQSNLLRDTLERFARVQPENPWANYYYAVVLWKRRKGAEDTATSAQVESLLHRAVRLDPTLANGYFQLGVLYSERKDLSRAISSYQSALKIDSELAEAHYRLAHAYMLNGQKWQGQEELRLYKQASKARADELERQRREVQQFVYTLQQQPRR